MSDHLHSLLSRQLKRCFGSVSSVPPALLPFIEVVNQAYTQSDVDRTMLERSLDLSSQELSQANAEMRRAVLALRDSHEQLERRVAERTRELASANETLRCEILDHERAERDLRHSEERLRQAQKMEAIGQLAGGVAHDFNNLLTAILGYTDMILDEWTMGPTRDAAEEVRKAAESAGALTHQLLAFSRRQVLTPTLVDLNALVEDVCSLLRRIVGEDIEVVTALAPMLGVVRADVGQLQQVLLNLAVNARDAMPQGGTLTIATAGGDATDASPAAVLGAYVTLSVTDTGTGMEPEVLARVFEPFFTTKALGRGTGLGLATVYGVVQQSGGTIDVTSRPGQGTTFTVALPREVKAADAIAERGSVPAPRGSELILLVEDEHGVRRMMRDWLGRRGYQIVEAVNGVDALEKAHGLPHIDLLLTDIVMPRMGGRDLAARLATTHPAAKVLYMSGYTGASAPTEAPSASLLQKPFSAARLLQAVRAELDTRERAASSPGTDS